MPFSRKPCLFFARNIFPGTRTSSSNTYFPEASNFLIEKIKILNIKILAIDLAGCFQNECVMFSKVVFANKNVTKQHCGSFIIIPLNCSSGSLVKGDSFVVPFYVATSVSFVGALIASFSRFVNSNDNKEKEASNNNNDNDLLILPVDSHQDGDTNIPSLVAKDDESASPPVLQLFLITAV